VDHEARGDETERGGPAVSPRPRLIPIVRKIAVGAAGGVVVMAGVALIVLPGPAIVVIPIGLSILAREFDWAKRLLGHARGFGARSLRRMAALRPRLRTH
jgi:hypothetical protein